MKLGQITREPFKNLSNVEENSGRLAKLPPRNDREGKNSQRLLIESNYLKPSSRTRLTRQQNRREYSLNNGDRQLASSGLKGCLSMDMNASNIQDGRVDFRQFMQDVKQKPSILSVIRKRHSEVFNTSNQLFNTQKYYTDVSSRPKSIVQTNRDLGKNTMRSREQETSSQMVK